MYYAVGMVHRHWSYRCLLAERSLQAVSEFQAFRCLDCGANQANEIVSLLHSPRFLTSLRINAVNSDVDKKAVEDLLALVSEHLHVILWDAAQYALQMPYNFAGLLSKNPTAAAACLSQRKQDWAQISRLERMLFVGEGGKDRYPRLSILFADLAFATDQLVRELIGVYQVSWDLDNPDGTKILQNIFQVPVTTKPYIEDTFRDLSKRKPGGQDHKTNSRPNARSRWSTMAEALLSLKNRNPEYLLPLISHETPNRPKFKGSKLSLLTEAVFVPPTHRQKAKLSVEFSRPMDVGEPTVMADGSLVQPLINLRRQKLSSRICARKKGSS